MGRVLIDDDDAVLGLGDDIGVVHLRAGDAQGRRVRVRRDGRARRDRRANEASATARRQGGRLVERRRIGERGLGEAGEARLVRRVFAMRRMGRRPARAQRGERFIGDGRGGAVALRVQGGLQCTDDQSTDETGIAEADLGLGRVDVDVDEFGIAGEEQRHRRDGGRARDNRHRRP